MSMRCHPLTSHQRFRRLCFCVCARAELDSGVRLNRGVSLRLQQLYAVFVKRLIISYRSPLMSLVQLFIPIIFTALGCIVQYSIPGAKDAPPLTLRFAYYDDPVVAYVGECTPATYVR